MYTKDCRNSTGDLHYKGHINTTISGYWKDIGHYNTEEKNYCRTPRGDADNAGGPWCYLSGGRWERCNVPVVSKVNPIEKGTHST